MLRLSVAVLLLHATALPLLGDDTAARERKVKVALALAGADPKVEKKSARTEPVAAKLDWLVDLTDAQTVKVPAPRPKVVTPPLAKEPEPQQELWLMHDAFGRQWYEWRDKAPQRMPSPPQGVH